VRRGTGSYYLKHLVEQWCRERGTPHYIANGTLITAAIELGYGAVAYGINCAFRFELKKAGRPKHGVAA
jgi:hypothetical protein